MVRAALENGLCAQGTSAKLWCWGPMFRYECPQKGRYRQFHQIDMFDNNINYMKYAFQNNIDFNLSKRSKIGLNLNVQLNSLHGPITASNGGGGIGNIFNAIM